MSETRKPSSPHWNAFPEAAGLELTAPQGMRAGGAFGLNAELIFGQQPLSGEGVSFRLGVKTGRLLLDLQGCAVVPGTRFAMHDQPAAVLRQEKIEEIAIDTRKVEISGEAILDFSGNGLKGQNKIGGQLSAQQTKVRKHTHDITEEIHKVVAHGPSIEPSWEIGGTEETVLKGRYLGRENLCEVTPEIEHFRITGRFVCRKRDLHLADLEYTRWLPPIPIVKKKLALAVVASELDKTVKQLKEEMLLTLCRSVLVSAADRDEQDDDR